MMNQLIAYPNMYTRFNHLKKFIMLQHLEMDFKNTSHFISYLFITFLLFQNVHNETDLSLNNCPDQFNITEANNTDGTGKGQMAVFFFSPFMDDQTVARVQKIIIQSDTQDLQKLVQQTYAIPFIAVGVVFGITFAIVVLCVVFEKSCPPCHSWRRDFAKRPYQKFQVRCVGLFAVIFAIAILGTSIAAFTYIPQLADEIQITKCALYGSLDVALNGDDEQWGGFSHIKNQVGNISLLLPASNTQVNTFFDDDETIQGSMDLMRQFNLQIYSTNWEAKVKTPDPNATAADLFIDSYFIVNTLGPNGTDGTMVNEVDEKLSNTATLSDQANEIINSAFLLVESAATIQANTDSSQQILQMYETQLNQYKADIDDFSNQYFDSFFNWGIYVVQVIMGFILVGSIAILIGSVSIQILDIYDCRHFLHFGWVVYGITYFGVVFVAFFALPMGSLGYTFCQYYQSLLVNETEFKRVGDYDTQHILNRLDVCIYGDGNVLQKFQIAEEMNTVSDLFLNIELFNEYDDPTSDKYIDQSLSQTEISDWILVLEDLKIGKETDQDPLLTTDANPLVALQKLNQYSIWTVGNAASSVPRCTRDRWVYDSSDCDGSDNLYDLNTDDPNYITMDYVTCFYLNQYPTTTSPGNWSYTDFTDRYKQIKNDCPGSYNEIMGYTRSILEYRDSRVDLFQGLIDMMTDLQTNHNAFDAIMTSFRGNLSSFESTQAIKDLSNFVMNQIDGLLVSSQCQPIGDHLVFLYNSFCVNAIGNTVSLGMCMMLLMCFLIGGLFTSCVYAQRTATIKRLFTIHEKNFALQDVSVHSQTFDRKKQQSSSSSSSSSQED